MSVEQMQADSDRAPRHFYAACRCGWCGLLRPNRAQASVDYWAHRRAKAKAATA